MNKSRIQWMDVMRGSMILLVIIQHWIANLPAYDSLSSSRIYEFIYDIKVFFAPYRMEILFFLSGLIVNKAIKKDFKSYSLGKVQNLLYPYLIWSFVYFLVINYKDLLLGDFVSPLKYVLVVLLGAGDLTWFLYFLFIFFMLSYYLFNKNVNSVFVIVTTVALYILVRDVELYERFDVEYIKSGDVFYYFIFFYIGCLLGFSSIDLISLSNNKFVLIFSLLCFVFVEFINFNYSLFKTSLIYLPFVLCSIPLFVFISNFLTKSKFLLKVLTHISVNSIVYYLLHLLLFVIYTKIFSVLGIRDSLALPLVLASTIFSIYFFIVIKKLYSSLNILFSPALLYRKSI